MTAVECANLEEVWLGGGCGGGGEGGDAKTSPSSSTSTSRDNDNPASLGSSKFSFLSVARYKKKQDDNKLTNESSTDVVGDYEESTPSHAQKNTKTKTAGQQSMSSKGIDHLRAKTKRFRELAKRTVAQGRERSSSSTTASISRTPPSSDATCASSSSTVMMKEARRKVARRVSVGLGKARRLSSSSTSTSLPCNSLPGDNETDRTNSGFKKPGNKKKKHLIIRATKKLLVETFTSSKKTQCNQNNPSTPCTCTESVFDNVMEQKQPDNVLETRKDESPVSLIVKDDAAGDSDEEDKKTCEKDEDERGDDSSSVRSGSEGKLLPALSSPNSCNRSLHSFLTTSSSSVVPLPPITGCVMENSTLELAKQKAHNEDASANKNPEVVVDDDVLSENTSVVAVTEGVLMDIDTHISSRDSSPLQQSIMYYDEIASLVSETCDRSKNSDQLNASQTTTAPMIGPPTTIHVSFDQDQVANNEHNIIQETGYPLMKQEVAEEPPTSIHVSFDQDQAVNNKHNILQEAGYPLMKQEVGEESPTTIHVSFDQDQAVNNKHSVIQEAECPLVKQEESTEEDEFKLTLETLEFGNIVVQQNLPRTPRPLPISATTSYSTLSPSIEALGKSFSSFIRKRHSLKRRNRWKVAFAAVVFFVVSVSINGFFVNTNKYYSNSANAKLDPITAVNEDEQKRTTVNEDEQKRRHLRHQQSKWDLATLMTLG